MYKRLKESYQPYYNPDMWNNNIYLRKSHNCYSYFLDDISDNLVNIFKKENKLNRKLLNPQPGHYCDMTKFVNYKDTTCESINKRVVCDNPNIFIISNNDKCPKNYYKGALRINKGKMYHFYRQDEDGSWSHKDGGQKVEKIKNNPEEENEEYPDFCNYYCVPKNNYMETNMGRNRKIDGKSWYKN